MKRTPESIAMQRVFSETAAEIEAATDEIPRGFVYYIQEGHTGPIKIGFTRKLAERIGSLQTGNSKALRVIAMMPAPKVLEGRIHRALARYRIHREWFSPTKEVLRAARLTRLVIRRALDRDDSDAEWQALLEECMCHG